MRSVVFALFVLLFLGALAPLALAQGSDDLIVEGLSLPRHPRYEIYNAGSGMSVRTAKVWVVASANLDRRDIVAEGTATSAPPGEWRRIHGRIESIQGSTLTVRTDDGKRVTVDVARVESSVRSGLVQGEGVTIIAYEWTGPTTVRASSVQQDSSDPARGGKIAPSASPR